MLFGPQNVVWTTESRDHEPRLNRQNEVALNATTLRVIRQNQDWSEPSTTDKIFDRQSKMPRSLGLDLASKRQRQRSDYTFREDYRTRWYAAIIHHLTAAMANRQAGQTTTCSIT